MVLGDRFKAPWLRFDHFLKVFVSLSGADNFILRLFELAVDAFHPPVVHNHESVALNKASLDVFDLNPAIEFAAYVLDPDDVLLSVAMDFEVIRQASQHLLQDLTGHFPELNFVLTVDNELSQ